MTATKRTRLADEIAALAHGKALFSLTPAIEALSPERREDVFQYLAHEYENFADAVERLLTPKRRGRAA